MKLSLKSIQEQPFQTRLRILYAVTAVIGIVLFVIWFMTTRGAVRRTDFSDISEVFGTKQQPIVTSQKYINVEWVEKADGKMLIFFKVTNDTPSILNLPQLGGISLQVGEDKYNAEIITTRQQTQFVQKVLSNSQNFGILVFSDMELTRADLVFDQMFFENKPDVFFQERFEVDFEELNKPLERRG